MRNTPDARFMWSGRVGIWVTGPGSRRRVGAGAGPDPASSRIRQSTPRTMT
nr:MAG TPA: hypothetical protein [Caudoviricetes sp.]